MARPKGGPALTDAEKAAKAVERQTEKETRFKTLGQKRLAAALDKIALLRNLANRNTYSWNDAQIKVISNALYDAVEKVIEGFAPQAKGAGKITVDLDVSDATEGTEEATE